jgi:hypothetical protein
MLPSLVYLKFTYSFLRSVDILEYVQFLISIWIYSSGLVLITTLLTKYLVWSSNTRLITFVIALPYCKAKSIRLTLPRNATYTQMILFLSSESKL